MTADVGPPVRIRPEEPGDRGAIHELHAASFPSAGEARLVDALRAAGRLWVSLVAVEEGYVVGHVAFSPAAGGLVRYAPEFAALTSEEST